MADGMIDAAELARLLARGVEGQVLLDVAGRARDFGGVLHRPPRVVVRAEREEDVIHCLAVARSTGVRVGFRGAGHTCHGQALCEGGIVIENFVDRADLELADDGQAVVAARSSWRRVEHALNERGRAVPVLTDFQDLSVGGTLSVGGHGVHSITRGLQVDHVDRARLVLADGSARWCSPGEDPELFRFSLAGLGQLGLIEAVVMRTVERKPFTSLYVCAYESAGALARSLAWLLDWRGEWPAHFNAVLYQGQVMAFWGAEHADAEAAGRRGKPEFLARLPEATEFQHTHYRRMTHEQAVDWLGVFGGHRKLWADYVFDHAGLCRFVEALEALRTAGAFDECLEVVNFLVVRRPPGAIPFAFEAPGGPTDGIKFSVGLYTMVPADRPQALPRVTDALRKCLDTGLALGGRPYLYGWHELDADGRRALYGDDYDLFLLLKARYDPRGLLSTRL